MLIRNERKEDEAAIRQEVEDAFAGAHSSGTEARIIDALRLAHALTFSLVAEEFAEVIGHCAVSPVTITRASGSWFGLGPVAVLPCWQGRGVGTALINAALDRLRAAGAAGFRRSSSLSCRRSGRRAGHYRPTTQLKLQFWLLQCQLERQLVAPFKADYGEILEAARARLTTE